MKITQKHVQDLLHLLTFGLCSGAGGYDHPEKTFCVQQAVHKVLSDDLKGYHTDNPDYACLMDSVRDLGVILNDSDGWGSNKNRADGLRRFAIAELGSYKLSYTEFACKFAEKLGVDRCGNNSVEIKNKAMVQLSGSRREKLTKIANAAADVLKEMGSEGGQFLYLLDEPNKKKRIEEAHKLGHKIYAAQLAEAWDSFDRICQTAPFCAMNKPRN